ncbi:MAG: cupredoxin family copper-binding protein [Anaerolineaceae bacterium]|nr:cupredoxin family copper-binding protein [Anaerolineaceae bacterium]
MDTGMAGEVEVNIADFNYDPQDLTVQVGDTVTWTNNDDVAHTVTAGTPDSPMGEFDSGELQPGDTFSYTFDQAGTFDYFCTLHPDMTASVTVEEATQ